MKIKSIYKSGMITLEPENDEDLSLLKRLEADTNYRRIQPLNKVPFYHGESFAIDILKITCFFGQTKRKRSYVREISK